MADEISRRRFVRGTATGAALAGFGGFGFLSQLQPLSAAEAKLSAGAVQFRPDIEPLVRLLETTSRDRLLEEIGGRPPYEEQADSGFSYYTRYFAGALPERRGPTMSSARCHQASCCRCHTH